jgi:Bifunctional DNA primase/polymerase, N-terminal
VNAQPCANAAIIDVLREAALRYAAAGWPVFPCVPGRKEPATRRGFKDATTSPAVIRRVWWERTPFNVAIATGAPGPDVLDVDIKPGGSGFAAFGQLQRAGLLAGAFAIVRTPSGGMHVYYQGSDQRGARLPRHYLDFRSRGGYVVAPPSTVDGRAYELVEKRAASGRIDWQAVSTFLDPPSPARPHQLRDGADVAALARWVAGLPEGNRNDGLFWAACRAVEAGTTDLDGLVAAAVTAGLPEGEAWRTVTSAERTARP